MATFNEEDARKFAAVIKRQDEEIAYLREQIEAGGLQPEDLKEKQYRLEWLENFPAND